MYIDVWRWHSDIRNGCDYALNKVAPGNAEEKATQNEVKAGTSFDEFPRVCVVFLLEHGEGCNGQLVERMSMSGTSGTRVDMPVEIYFVNGALQDESVLGTMMGDMRSSQLRRFRDRLFRERMEVLLCTDIGRREMCEAERIWVEEIKTRSKPMP